MSDERPMTPETIRINLQLFAQEKTEPATPRRRQEARRKGQVARTPELGTALVILACLPAVHSLLGSMGDSAARFTEDVYTYALVPDDLTAGTVHRLLTEMAVVAVRTVWPVLALAFVLGTASQVAQVGFLVAGEAVKPKAERINPVQGLKRMFSKRAVVELLKAVLKVVLISGICYSLVKGALPLFPQLALLEPLEAVTLVGQLVVRMGLTAGIVLLVIAVGDYAFQRFELNKSLRMSKQELKEELRQSEGDPQVRARLRQRQRELAMGRMMADVPKADVVITNPVHIAVALQYDPNAMNAPVVLAKGAGRVAERIKEIAREHRIAVVENVWLARTLFDTVPVGREIPAELYQAVAEVLAFVYRLRRRTL